MKAWAGAVLLLAVGVAGCNAPGLETGGPSTAQGPAPFLLLEATYVRDPGTSGGFGGNHCADAFVRDDEVRLHDALKEELGQGPTLVVEPATQGRWATTGDGGYALRIPAEVHSGAEGDGAVWTTIDWQDSVQVDGAPVTLPHNWTVEREGYQIHARLSVGPVDHTWFQRDTCM